MEKGKKFLPYMLLLTGIVLLLFLIMQPLSILQFHSKIAILFPKGIIALEERNLLFIIQAIMLVVILPVYFLTFFFSWRYNVFHPKAKYDPDLIDNKLAEFIWWGIPCVLTALVAFLTWRATYQLDPYKPIESDKKPITIQVVALQWKWLFLYPEEKIATVNFVQFPSDVPIHFEITADAPMNSFWIPHLGGQIYAMPKMKSELHLIANERGDFRGSSANLSGEGFAGMHFIARATSEEAYLQWVKDAKASADVMDLGAYKSLALPTQNQPVQFYRLEEKTLFHKVLMKYMHPQGMES